MTDPTPITMQAIPDTDWTDDDVDALEALIQKRKTYFDKSRKHLSALIDAHIQHHDEDGVIAMLTEHADEFIKALRPWE